MDKAQIQATLEHIDVWLLVFGIIVVIGVGGESIFGFRHWWNSRKLQAIQETEETKREETIANLNRDAAALRKDTAEALERAAKAEENLGDAKKSAAEANAKAEGFRLDIAKANESAAQARAQVANATAEAAKANLELAKLKTPRSLTRIPELIALLAPFKDTEYVFVSVFSDEESINLLKSVHEVLQKAGWKRGKSVGGFPAINVYGREMPDFFVPSALSTGIKVSTEFPEPIDFSTTNLQVKDFPANVQAAGTLNHALLECVSPHQDNSVDKVAEVGVGTSIIVRIAIGKKP
jgi:hypothetical protein